jgi:Retroviral aspartyl protease
MVAALLQIGGPYPGDLDLHCLGQQFEIVQHEEDKHSYLVIDHLRGLQIVLPKRWLDDEGFDIFSWYRQELRKHCHVPVTAGEPLPNEDNYFAVFDLRNEDCRQDSVHFFGVQISREMLPALQRNASVTRDVSRTVPKPIIIMAKINGNSVRALVDSGSLGDFMSTTLADQLKVPHIVLEKPLPLQLAVQGSRSKINLAHIGFQYQGIKEQRYFDIMNISSYYLILGCPWIYQHRVTLGLNPTTVVVGSDMSLPLNGDSVTRIALRAMEVYEDL